MASQPFTGALGFDVGKPKGVKNDKVPMVIDERRDLGKLEEASKTCAAGSFARSLDWLNRRHSLDYDKNLKEIYDELRGNPYKVSDPSVGTTAEEIERKWIEEKNKYAKTIDNNIITKVWDGNNFYTGQIPGVQQQGGDFIDWLKKEIEHGEDVEIAYEWSSGTKKGAHIAAVTQLWMTEDGKIWVETRDDGRQGPNTVGDRTWKRELYKKNGKYHLGSDARTIRTAVSESIPEPTSVVLLALGSLMLVSRRRRTR